MKQIALATIIANAIAYALAHTPAQPVKRTPLMDLNDGLTVITAKTRKNGIDRYFAPHFQFIKRSAKHSSTRIIAETLFKRDGLIRKHYGDSPQVMAALYRWMKLNGVTTRFARS
jgi:hypothetical protein